MVNKKVWAYGIIIWLAGILAACDSGGEASVTEKEDYSNCRYEKPEAIFYDGLPQISKHTFTSHGRGSEENFVLAGSIEVTIVQYGCDYRTQEFQFTLPDRDGCSNPEDCTLEIVHLLQSLSRLGPEYHVFRAWGQAIKKMAGEIRYDQSIELAEGFWIKIGQGRSFGNSTLTLTLSEKP